MARVSRVAGAAFTRDAAVLDLGLTQEADGALLANGELVVVGEVHRVPVAEDCAGEVQPVKKSPGREL